MHRQQLTAMVLGCITVMGSVQADTKQPVTKDDPVWKLQAELGFVKTTGNTETETTNAKARATNERNNWRHEVRFETVRSADNTGTTAERYLLSGKTDYNMTTLSYLFAKLQYEDDRFNGYQYQASLIAGYGYHLFKGEPLKWDVEAGGGLRKSKLDDGTSESEGVMALATSLDWKMSESARLTEEVNLDVGEERTISKSVTALITKINASLSSRISYTVKHNSKVPAGTEKTDTETAITLVYSF